MTSKSDIPASASMSLLIAGSMCMLPFLLPFHQLPVKSFQAEWLAAALGTAAILALCFDKRSVKIPASALWLCAFGLVLLIGTRIRPGTYPQLALWGAIYSFFAASMIWLGAMLAAGMHRERLATALAAFILAGALASAIAGFVQFYYRPAWMEDWVAELHGSRAYGNIAQFNLYANYLALGLASLIFLWMRNCIPFASLVAGIAFFNGAAALSGSRTWLLYICLFSAVAWAASRRLDVQVEQRAKTTLRYLIALTLLIQICLPWINEFFGWGPDARAGMERALSTEEYTTDGRWQAWLVAWRIFLEYPIFGIGLGEFASTAFHAGMPPLMARGGEVWTAVHNLFLQLLAETGMVGTGLVLGSMISWWLSYKKNVISVSHTDARQHLCLDWTVSIVGVEFIQSMLEYPLWNAHFLAMTALVLGTGEVVTRAHKGQSPLRATLIAACAASTLTLAIILKEYVRLDSTLITGTSSTLASPADKERDKAIMKDLATGLFAPTAELWMALGYSLDRTDLKEKLAVTERVLHYWPSHSIIVKTAIFLALSGDTQRAEQLLGMAMKTFRHPHQCEATVRFVELGREADPTAMIPLLDIAAKTTQDCQ